MYWEAFGGMRAYALWNEQARRMVLERGLAGDPLAAALQFGNRQYRHP